MIPLFICIFLCQLLIQEITSLYWNGTSFLGYWYEYSKMKQEKAVKILRISFTLEKTILPISQKTLKRLKLQERINFFVSSAAPEVKHQCWSLSLPLATLSTPAPRSLTLPHQKGPVRALTRWQPHFKILSLPLHLSVSQSPRTFLSAS